MTTIYFNGDFLPAEAVMHRHDDRGFLYGDGVFTTLRSFNGRLFRADAHTRRLLASAQALGFTGLPSAEALTNLLQEMILRNPTGTGDLYLRATITRGNGYGPGITRSFDANLLIYAKPLPPADPTRETKGITAVTTSEARSASATLARHKSTSYLECLLARREAKERGADEALISDTDGYLLEGACSNLFLCKNGMLLTPPLTQNLLPGITRSVVLELAETLKIIICEKPLLPDDLIAADEAFLTNSGQGLIPLVKINNDTIGSGQPGPITQELLLAYHGQTAGKT